MRVRYNQTYKFAQCDWLGIEPPTRRLAVDYISIRPLTNLVCKGLPTACSRVHH